MFKLKYVKEFGAGGSKGKGSSQGASTSVGSRQGTAISADTSRQTGTQRTIGSTASNKQSQTTGSTGTRGSQRTSGSSKTSGVQKVNNKGTAAASLEQTLSSLDKQTQGQLTDIINAIGSPEQAGQLQDLISGRALNADAALNENTGAIVDEARRQGENKIDAAVTNLSKVSGSSQNSLVTKIGLDAAVNLESELAGLEAELFGTNRQIASGELQAAQGGQISSVAGIADILKGAQQTTSQQTLQQQQNTGATTNVSATQTEQDVQTQQLVNSLQSAIESGNTSQLTDILNQLNIDSTKVQSINENSRQQGNSGNVNQGSGTYGGVSYTPE